jgi:hypothetical protein
MGEDFKDDTAELRDCPYSCSPSFCDPRDDQSNQVPFLQRKTESEDQIIRSPQSDDATPSRDFALLGESVVLLSAQNVTEWRLRP